MSIHVIVYFTF